MGFDQEIEALETEVCVASGFDGYFGWKHESDSACISRQRQDVSSCCASKAPIIPDCPGESCQAFEEP